MKIAEQAMMDPSFNCPFPECAVEIHTVCEEIPLKTLFYSRFVDNKLFNTIKVEIDKVKKNLIKESISISDGISIPKTIQVSDKSSAESKSSSKDTQLVKKTKDSYHLMLSFLQYLFTIKMGT